jgi:hypothetical protein
MSEGGKKAYVPDFEYDVFISYAWVNNYPDVDDEPESGWVTRFKKKLQRHLDERLGRTNASKIFVDRVNLKKNQDFNPQIEAAVKSSAVFVAMFSDGYVASPGCRDEIRHFANIVGGELPRSGRFFLARIDHVDRDSWPDEFDWYTENLIGYDFVAPDPINERLVRIRYGDDQFHRPLEDLRTDLATKLKEMRKERDSGKQVSGTHDEGNVTADSKRPTILISQATADLRKQRRQLVNYCENAQLQVLGAAPYAAAPESFQESFRSDLQQANLFVQVLSDCYSDRTEGFPDGKELWQLNEARAAGLSVLQWHDSDLELEEIDDCKHADLVTHPDVRTDPPASFHKDVVDRAQRAFDVGRAPPKDDDAKYALVKFAENVQGQIGEMLNVLKDANVSCLSSTNGRPMIDQLREIPFSALVVVLGDSPRDWLEDRGQELLSVELNLKDQAPVRAYYYCGNFSSVPPFVGSDVLEIHGRQELGQLVEAIKKNGGKS